MRKDVLLVPLTFIGTALCWWPVCMEPGLDLPWWLPLAFVALLTGLPTILSSGRWLRFLVASTVGSLSGLCSGTLLWPTEDVIGRGNVGYFIVPAAAISVLVSLVASLAMRKLSATNEKRRSAIWILFVCSIAFGPVAILLTSPLVARRIERNEMSAAERFESLSNAAQQTRQRAVDPELICDGQELEANYSGPPFSENDWQHIVGNYVKEDGYAFGMWCHQTGSGGYTIDAYPVRPKVDGVRQFCADESGRAGCGMAWNGTRNACLPCTK